MVARQLEQELPGNGVRLKGPRSYGRNDDGTVKLDEVRVLREMWPQILGGDSVYHWVKALNERGVPTSRGNTWTTPGLTFLLRNPRLAGYRWTREKQPRLVPVEGLEPIVSIDEHKQMCAVLDERAGDREPRTDTPSKRKFYLSGGLLKCSNCGKALHSKRATSGNPGYVCIKTAPHFGCGKIRIMALPLEEAVAAKVLGRLAAPQNMARLIAAVATSESTGKALAASIGEVEDEIRRLSKMRMRGELGALAYKAAQDEADVMLRGFRSEVKQLEAFANLPRLSTESSIEHQAKMLELWWNHEATVEDKHDLVSALLDEIRILPGRPGFRAYDPDRVIYVWRP